MSTTPIALVALVAVACGQGSYSFVAQPALENGCLGRRVAVDVLAGEDPGACAPRCIAGPRADGGRATYVAETCGPLPRFFEDASNDPFCAAALAAARQGCALDAGRDTGVD